MITQHESRRGREQGFAVPMLFVLVLALLLLAGGAIQVSTSKQAVTVEELSQERAFQAAEAGIDHACYLANTLALVPGKTMTVSMGRGQSYTVTAVDMRTDGVDNDVDGAVDEPDETGYAVTSLGVFKSAQRRLVAYVRQLAAMPAVDAVVTCTDPTATVSVSGKSFTMKGSDENPDGTPGTGAPVRGIGVASPGTTASLLSGLSAGQKGKITGVGGTPSAMVTPPLDLAAFAAALEPLAQNVIAPGKYGKVANFGSASADVWRISWCPGSLGLKGGASGAGILIVAGNLDMAGNCDFTGLVIVKGNLSLNGGGSGKSIRGAVLVDGNVKVNGGVDFQYSNLAITKVSSLIARHTVTGWREIAR